MIRRPNLLMFILLSIILLSMCVGFFVYRPLWHANHFLRDSLALRVGSSTFADAQKLAAKYGGQVIQVGDIRPICSSTSCVYKFAFRNVWLHGLGLAPSTTFGGEVRVSNNIVVSRELASGVERPGNYLETFSREKQTLTGGADVRLVEYRKLPRIGIEITSLADPEARELSSKFDLECLVKIRGCTSITELLPGIKKFEQMGYNLELQR